MLLEDKGKNFIFLRLPEKCVSELNLTCDQEFHAEVRVIVKPRFVLLNNINR